MIKKSEDLRIRQEKEKKRAIESSPLVKSKEKMI